MRSVLAVGSSLILVVSLGTQAGAQPPDRPASLSVKTQLVVLDVVVKDSHGDPVHDLKKSDFEVLDNGKRQDVKIFSVEDYLTKPEGEKSAVSALPSAGALSRGRDSNRAPAVPNATNAPTVIVIDAANTWDPSRMTWADLAQARDALIQFLRQVRPEDRLGIYLMGPRRFWVLREYTQDCADLVERLVSWKGSATPGLADTTGSRPLDAWTEFALHFIHVDAETAKAIHRDQFYSVDPMLSSALPPRADDLKIHAGVSSAERTTNPRKEGEPRTTLTDHGVFVPQEQGGSLAILGSVAAHLAAIPGRKNLILISVQTFLPVEHKDRLKVLRNILRTGVSIYSIDPGGLAPYLLDASFAIPSAATAFNPDSRAALRYIDQAYEGKKFITTALQTSLVWLAEETGGQSFINTNDIPRAIRKSFEDSRLVYTLGFYAKSPNTDGSYHSLKVKVAGAGLTVRARPGYFELAEPSRDRKIHDAELRQAVWSPIDASLIELSGKLTPSGTSEDPAYALDLNFGVAGVSLRPHEGRMIGQVEVIVVQRDSAGTEYDPSLQTLGLSVAEAELEKRVRTGLTYRREFKPDPKASSLRVVVRDVSTGNIGTLTIPLPPDA